MSSTDMAYGALSRYALPTRCPLLMVPWHPPAMGLFNLKLELAAKRAESGELSTYALATRCPAMLVPGYCPDTKSIEFAVRCIAVACAENRSTPLSADALGMRCPVLMWRIVLSLYAVATRCA
eukprot:2815069-Rhodomonas_salina.2